MVDRPLTPREIKLRELDHEMARIQRKAVAERNVAKLDELRAEYRKVHRKWYALSCQTELDLG